MSKNDNRDSVGSHCYALYADSMMADIAKSFGVPALMPGEYRNPFNIIDEFEEWFAFEKLRHFDKEPTHKIIGDMLRGDIARAQRSLDTDYTMLKWYANQHYGTYQPVSRVGIIYGTYA